MYIYECNEELIFARRVLLKSDTHKCMKGFLVFSPPYPLSPNPFLPFRLKLVWKLGMDFARALSATMKCLPSSSGRISILIWWNVSDARIWQKYFFATFCRRISMCEMCDVCLKARRARGCVMWMHNSIRN